MSVHLFLCLWVRLAKFVNTTKQLENLTGVWTNGLAGGQEGRGSEAKGEEGAAQAGAEAEAGAESRHVRNSHAPAKCCCCSFSLLLLLFSCCLPQVFFVLLFFFSFVLLL